MKEKEFFNRKFKAEVIELEDLKKEVYDKEWLEKAGNMPLYYVYKDVHKKEDRDLLMNDNLQYNVIEIPAKRLGPEFVKTQAYYVSNEFSEIYEVLQGKADFMLQKREGRSITKATVVRVKTGDHVILPPNFGCTIINTSSKDTLKVARLASRSFKRQYQLFKEKGGACYLELVRGFKKNENYSFVPELEIYEAAESDLFKNRNVYDLIQKPKIFDFINRPKEDFFQRLEYQ